MITNIETPIATFILVLFSFINKLRCLDSRLTLFFKFESCVLMQSRQFANDGELQLVFINNH